LLLEFINAFFARWDGRPYELNGNALLIMFGLLQFGECFQDGIACCDNPAPLQGTSFR